MKNFMKKLTKIILVLVLISFSFLTYGCDDTLKIAKLYVSKDVYKKGEEIVVKANGNEESWVGVYRENDNVSQVEPIAKYTVNDNGFLPNQSYIIQRSATFSESRYAFAKFPSTKYKVVLFGNTGTNLIVSIKYFSVSKEELSTPSAPTKLEYEIKYPNTGLAEGTVKIYFDEVNFDATEVKLYWANESGILKDWTAFALKKVISNPFNYEIVAGTIIPYEATKIRAYSINKVGQSESYCEIDLPNNSGYNISENTLSKFEVVSDVHIAVANTHLASSDAKELHSQHLLQMGNDIVNISPNSDALIVVGDIANSGQESEWQENARLLSTIENLPNVYYSLGNHDLYNGVSTPNYKKQVGLYYKYANTDSVYYEKIIGGFSHIFLGSESSNYSSVDAYLSDTQLSWFEQRLDVLTKEDNQKPIFVYLHQSLYNTIAGSFKGQGWNGVYNGADNKLRNILKNYPQVIMFNGHSHWDMNSVGNMYKADGNLPNIFNTGAVSYLWSSYDIPKGEYLKGSQGYYIRVYYNKVLVLGRDFETNQYISSACYVI